MTSSNKKIDKLLTLGRPKINDYQGINYSELGISQSDIKALLALIRKNFQSDDEMEFYAIIHAWRALEELKHPDAILPLIEMLDELNDSDWALEELPVVFKAHGKAIIKPLSQYIREADHEEYAKVIAMDALAELALDDPSLREQIICEFDRYLSTPDDKAYALNGLLIGQLIKLNGVELIDKIRNAFKNNVVDICCAGDLEDVEIEFGLRTERETPKPNYGLAFSPIIDDEFEDDISPDEFEDKLEYYLYQYGSENAICDLSELHGFFIALACAPKPIMPSSWFPAIWGGEEYAPEWDNKEEFNEFSQLVFDKYNQTMTEINQGELSTCFNYPEPDGKGNVRVDEWCNGFMRGVNFFGPLPVKRSTQLQKFLRPIMLFVTEDGWAQLDKMTFKEIESEQNKIGPAMVDIYDLFQQDRIEAFSSFDSEPPIVTVAPYVREQEKIGRNEPCFCGSGKKYKKCCLH